MAAFLLSLGTVWLGLTLPTPDLPPDAWSGMMMVYAFVASILPVWLLLQPRDYLNSLLLYLGLISLFAFAFLKIDGQPAGLALWALFGTTNQLLGGLTLITVTLYLILRKKNCLYTFVPMVFMVVTTVAAMSSNVLTFYREGQTLLLVLGVALLLLAAWVVVEGAVRFSRVRAEAT